MLVFKKFEQWIVFLFKYTFKSFPPLGTIFHPNKEPRSFLIYNLLVMSTVFTFVLNHWENWTRVCSTHWYVPLKLFIVLTLKDLNNFTTTFLYVKTEFCCCTMLECRMYFPLGLMWTNPCDLQGTNNQLLSCLWGDSWRF